MSRPSAIRVTVLLLALCQALAMTSMSILATTSAIIGNMLAADKALSTVPVALQMTGMLTATLPAAFLMVRIGRRGGFWTGCTLGIAGAATAGFAVWQSSFPVFCLGTLLIGSSNGFAQQYRFAAAECADQEFRSKAISLVLAGGVVSGIFGPQTAIWSRDLFAPILFAGCFVMVAALQAGAAILLLFVRLPPALSPELRASGRPLRRIIAQPALIVAVLAGTAGYAVMSLLMTATPIAMIGCGYGFADAAFVIQWHVLGMYAPSFVTGHLISRFGLTQILLTGAALLLVCCGINLSGIAVLDFWSALTVLGIGWNFLFIGATTLLTQTYAPHEKAKVQAVNDFTIFGVTTIAAFLSGALLTGFGWNAIQFAVMPVIATAAIAVLWLRLAMRGGVPRYAGE
ncbi:MAG: MFS transporter [Alphaproteobacteria bacterium]|nr:MFS transporter [Alphaproteobacteria bacterium]